MGSRPMVRHHPNQVAPAPAPALALPERPLSSRLGADPWALRSRIADCGDNSYTQKAIFQLSPNEWLLVLTFGKTPRMSGCGG